MRAVGRTRADLVDRLLPRAHSSRLVLKADRRGEEDLGRGRNLGDDELREDLGLLTELRA